MSRELLTIAEEAIKIIGEEENFIQGANKLFAMLASYVPIRTFYWGFFDQNKMLTVLMAVTNHQGSKLYFQHYPLKKEGEEPKQALLDYFQNPFTGMINDPNDPFIKLFDTLPADILQIPFVNVPCPHPSLKHGGLVFSMPSDAELPSDFWEILRALRLPFNIFMTNHYKNWQLQQINAEIGKENANLRKTALGLQNIELIGATGGLSQVVDKLKQVAPMDINLLISGETGTGKEVMAKACHELSPRRQGPFIAINCGAIPANLIDNELFGHAKGAYTGATENYQGRFERAKGGTLFLDEIGELALDVQARLLRVLETRTMERLGGRQIIETDFRLIAATNRDLAAMVETGTFRKDLYYRLAVVSLKIPALRERKQDIPLLAKYFIEKSCAKFQFFPLNLYSKDIQYLCQHSWEGNVRELQNVIEEAIVLSHGQSLDFSNLSKKSSLEKVDNLAENTAENTAEKLAEAENTLPLLAYEEMMQAYLTKVLKKFNGKIQGEKSAAQFLGLNANTLRAKLKKYKVKSSKE